MALELFDCPLCGHRFNKRDCTVEFVPCINGRSRLTERIRVCLECKHAKLGMSRYLHVAWNYPPRDEDPDLTGNCR